MMSHNYKYLVECLRLLRLPREEISTLLGDEEDIEIFNIFFDAFVTLPNLIEKKEVNSQSTVFILRCYIKFDWAMRNNRNVEWDEINENAKHSLILLAEELKQPDVDCF